MVSVSLVLGGERTRFIDLELIQEYGNHHRFTIRLDHGAVSQEFSDGPRGQLGMMGRTVSIDIRRGGARFASHTFVGVVTDVRMVGRDGKKGHLLVVGSSPTVMLERGPRMEVYSGMPLERIFGKLVEGIFTGYMKCSCSPSRENPVDFLMQYGESDWDFLRRVAYFYGENLHYDGTELRLGPHPGGEEPSELVYDRELTDLEFCSRLVPNASVDYHYLAEGDTLIERPSPTSIDGSNRLLDLAGELGQVFTLHNPPHAVFPVNADGLSELDDLSRRIKARTAARTVFLRGRCKTPGASVGRLISVSMPSGFRGWGELGSYRVVRSVHRINERMVYSNEFEAVPSSLGIVPVAEPPVPVAGPIVGKVASNEDPLGQGRVQVDFPFTAEYSRVWMRVMTPGAGLGDDLGPNRGMVFVPEKGDQVMVGFEYGHPDRPYVMGSLFHGKSGRGGQEGNHLKSITTRSGHTLEFDDADGSPGITIRDRNGNTIHLDTKEKNIEVTAPETITLTAKNIRINANDNITMSSGINTDMQVGSNMSLSVSNEYVLASKKSTVTIGTDSILYATKIKHSADEVSINSTKENMILSSSKKVDVQSSEKVNLL
jgi:hypothetical protein